MHTNLNFGKAPAGMHAMHRYAVFSPLAVISANRKPRQELSMRYHRDIRLHRMQSHRFDCIPSQRDKRKL